MPLRLKSLELQGYKTFATRTLFEFASGITAIVGPNGSGKSNIADAMRWVLGEQSYSLLRGKKTEDMIFSGSEHRPRAGMAQAALIFDNSETWLPVDFSEVALARHAFRDGRNDYILNGRHVRLRDINELLSQAGLSERTYTILGQGLVDASLALKADERRRLFEEAAGVGLYRTRRDEALKRLEHTERNLERVLDIMNELEPRLRTLERQAKRAIDYSRAQADLRVILLEWYGYHWHHDQQLLADAREAVHAQEGRVRQSGETYQKAQAEYAAFRDRLSGLRSELNKWHHQSAELHSQRESVSRALAVLEERRRSLAASHQGLLADQERAVDEEKVARERLTEAEDESIRQQAEYEEARQQLAVAQNNLQTRQSEREALEAQLTEARERMEAANQQRAEAQARLDELKARMQTQGQKLEHANQALFSAKAAMRQAEEKSQSAASAKQIVESELQKAEAEQGSRKTDLEKLELARREALESRAKQEADHTRTRAQLEVLTQAEQSLAGFAEGARFILEAAQQSRLKGARGALSAVLDVPAELETAIAAALGDTLDAILLEAGEMEEALRLLETDEAGRAALIPVDGAGLISKSGNEQISKIVDEDCLGVASELVNAPGDVRQAVQLMLGQTLIVKSRAAARRLLTDLPRHARLVTLRGEVFRGDGLVIAGKTAASSTLSRPRQKRELESALIGISASLNGSNDTVHRLSEEITTAQRELAQAERAAAQARLKLDQSQESEQQAGLESESKRRQLQWQEEQSKQLQLEAQEAAALRQKLMDTDADVQQSLARSQDTLKELTSRLAEFSLDELQSQAAYWSTRVAVTEQAMDGVKARKVERSNESARLDERKSELAGRLLEVDTALSGLEAEKGALREQEVSFNTQLEELNVKMGPAEHDLETAEQQEASFQVSEANAQRAQASAERTLGQVQLDHVRRQEMLNTLREKITDDFGLVMFDYAEDVSGPVPLPLEGLVEQLPVVIDLAPELEGQLTTQRARLRRLGPVNPEAKQEFDAESERYSFLKTQVDDLHKAEADLKQVIAELDDLTRRDFIKTFEAVDKEFRQTFVRLFGGGSARLSLTDPKNLVETGIEIEARLPGRREQGLALLSGGERSLTAIALVFALLKVSPTPLCVLDEVDAMLDEANVGRFRDLLGELSRDTQFIIITHNRNTVQAADVIYGITMGRDSTSQVISLRLDQVTDEMLVR